MEEVIAVDTPIPKRRRLIDYFAKLPSNTEAQEFPQCLMSILVQDDKRFSDTRLSHFPVDVVAPYSCLNKKRKHWRALERAIVLPTEGHVLCIQLFGTSNFW